ncbi:MAG: hypothetical protein CMH83_08465 [Nocardioides sp.]|nr:hypothetical protein [Nocardioides sp.]
MVDRPRSVTWAVRLVLVMVLLAVVVTALAVVFDAELVEAWTGGEGLSADDTRVPASYLPVAVVLCLVVSVLLLVLVTFLRGGHNWARHCIAAAGVLSAVVVASALRVSPPAPFVALGVVFWLLDAALLVALYRPGTTCHVTAWKRRPRSGADEGTPVA